VGTKLATPGRSTYSPRFAKYAHEGCMPLQCATKKAEVQAGTFGTGSRTEVKRERRLRRIGLPEILPLQPLLRRVVTERRSTASRVHYWVWSMVNFHQIERGTSRLCLLASGVWNLI
jgi:hypothetical protein